LITPLTRAEERALRRSEPLTPVQFKELRRLAEQGVSPLRHI
jgi:predicted nuclease with RNAse H fold